MSIQYAIEKRLVAVKILWRLTAFYIFNAILCYALLWAKFEISLQALLISTAFGIFFWTFLEYAIHRFFLHPDVKSPILKKILHFSHIKHHEDSENPNIFHIPLLTTIPIYFLVAGVLYLFIQNWAYVLAIMPAVMIFYVFFEWFHYWVHTTPSRRSLARWYRKYHFVHHYKDEGKSFGVTTPLWDIIFKTR